MADAAAIQQRLLAATDVGTSFHDEAEPSGSKPLPCAAAGSPTLAEQAPASVQSGRVISNRDGSAQFSEEVRVYATDAAAAHALQIITQGLGCARGIVYGGDGSPVPMTLTAGQDVGEQVGGDAVAWQGTSSVLDGVFIVAHSGDVLVTMAFAKDPALSSTGLPDPLTVAHRAVVKLQLS